MRTTFLLFAKSLLFALLPLVSPGASGQAYSWDYQKTLETKGYEGQRFRVRAMVRVEPVDDSATAYLWARVDYSTRSTALENIKDRPIRGREWREYAVEGRIGPGSTALAFGFRNAYNGRFLYDDFRVDIETGKGGWRNVLTADFEDGVNPFSPRTQAGKLYRGTVEDGLRGQGKKCLAVVGTGAPTYGVNRKAGGFASVNGIRLYYEVYGQGPPLLVLHGNGGSIGNATPFYGELIKKYQVIAVDSRAQGYSGDTPDPLTYEQMASDVNGLLEQLKVDSALVWGQSDGAILGLILAMDYPKKVKRVLAFGANTQPDSSAIFPWAVTFVAKAASESKDPKEAKLNRLMRDHPNIPYARLSRIKAPVLLVAGDRDMIRPEHTLRLFQSIPNSQMCILPGTTHGAAWEKRELFLGIMEEFFSKPFQMPDTKDWW